MQTATQGIGNKVKLPWYQSLFLKIAEPRVIRLMQLAVYLLALWAGVTITRNLPETLTQHIGDGAVALLGMFIIVGSAFGTIAVLPGIWWLERVALILLTTSVFMYVVILITNQASAVVIAFVLGLSLCFGQRWLEIRGAQLAPRED